MASIGVELTQKSTWRHQGLVGVRSLPDSLLGSSIVYAVESGANVRWMLYTKPIRIESSTKLRVKAGRLGFRDSPEVVLTFDIL